jgi:exosome complex RNA-binding protein Rrp4
MKKKYGNKNEKNQNKSEKEIKFNKQNNNKISNSVKKLLLFPGEEYDFDSSLLHYDAFGYNKGSLVAKRCGILLTDNQGKILESHNEEVFKTLGKYYSPKVDDVVLGIIVQKSAEFYKVDINSYTHAILNTKDFEGATKKSKPNLNLGDIVFARVSKLNKFDTPMLSCISSSEHKNWASGESFFGVIKGGNVFNFDKVYTWEFYREENFTFNRLRDMVNYEVVVGFNGRMWIKSDRAEDVNTIYSLLIKSLISSEEAMEKNIHQAFINKLIV